LCRACESALIDSLTVATVLAVVKFANDMNALQLYKRALDFAYKHIIELQYTDEWATLDALHLRNMLVESYHRFEAFVRSAEDEELLDVDGDEEEADVGEER
jgi:hypothetical protein